MIVTLNKLDNARNVQPSRADVQFKITSIWGSFQLLERTYGARHDEGFGARRAVKKYSEALQRLADD